MVTILLTQKTESILAISLVDFLIMYPVVRLLARMLSSSCALFLSTVWKSVQKFPLKVFFKNKSPLSASTLKVFLSFFLLCVCVMKENDKYL
jgi:hypothetical protein